MTSTVIGDAVEFDIPSWVVDIASFRKWLDDPKFPENVPIWWLRGRVWVDMSKEQGFWHNRVRTKITSTLDRLVENDDSGVVFSEGMFLVNPDGDIAGNPDLIYVSHQSLRSGAASLIEGAEGGATEVHGSPDMVLEVVSRSSVRKDNEELFQAYWDAGIAEYWLVDARRPPLKWDIWKHSPEGYVATRKRDGWAKSTVFGKSFRLSESTDRSELPTYRLEVK